MTYHTNQIMAFKNFYQNDVGCLLFYQSLLKKSIHIVIIINIFQLLEMFWLPENPFPIFLAILICLVYIYFRNAYTYWQKMGVPQLDPSFPFGDMASVIFHKQNMGDKIKEIYDKMKGHRYVGLYFFSRKAFLPLDPVLIKDILNTDFQHFYDRGIYYDEETDPLSAHMFSIAGNNKVLLFPCHNCQYFPVVNNV